MKSFTTVIELNGLTKNFGKFTAVDTVTLQIRKGEILGFLGPNGAGKSTTMKMMAYLLRPSKGDIKIRHNGTLESLNEYNKDKLLDKMGFLIESPSFYKSVSPRQILTYFAKLKGYPREKINQRVESLLMKVGMFNWIDEKLGKFSKGMKQKIGICSAIVHDPEIIVLDEPYTGLDPAARREIRDFILQLKDQGKTIFISSHLLYEISEVADRVAIISHGKLIACDTLENLEQQAKASTIHLEILHSISSENISEPAREETVPNHAKTALITQLYQILHQYVEMNSIHYVEDGNYYAIQFDGNPQKQHQILKALVDNGIKVLEFSVPKAGLLENLYLNFITQSEKEMLKTQKSEIRVEAVL